jgi:hypothetical protein
MTASHQTPREPNDRLDIVLPLAFAALALVAAFDFARAGWPNATGLCMGCLVIGLLWVRAVLAPILDGI